MVCFGICLEIPKRVARNYRKETLSVLSTCRNLTAIIFWCSMVSQYTEYDAAYYSADKAQEEYLKVCVLILELS